MTVTLENIRVSELPEKLKKLGMTDDQLISVAVTTLSDDTEPLQGRSLDDIARIISLRAEARGLSDEELERLLPDA
ncbi:MAG: hypothetical protein M3Z21_11335 [Pseudomonadota bacterium]|nr:hypothetical protein [Pseudomonadota bacterium]